MVPKKTYTFVIGIGKLCTNQVTFTPPPCYHVEIVGETGENSIAKSQSGPDAHDAGGTWKVVLRRNGEGDAPLGTGSNANGCVSVSINLGMALPNQPGGELAYLAETLDASAYALDKLWLSVKTGATVVHDDSLTHRQVHTMDGLADLVALPGSGFEVNCYHLADTTDPNSPGDYYGVTGPPFVTWRFTNPGDTVEGWHRMQVDELWSGREAQCHLYTLKADGSWLLDDCFGAGASLDSKHRSLRHPDTVMIGGVALPVEVYTEQQFSAHGVAETTVTITFADTAPAPLAGRLYTTMSPDGRVETYIYTAGTYNASTRGFTPTVAGDIVRTESVSGTILGLTANKSTKDVTVAAADGRVMLEEFRVYDGTAFQLVNQTWHTYGGDGKLQTSVQDGRTVFSSANVDEATDETGITRQVFNGGSRKLAVPEDSSVNPPYPAQAELKQENSSNSGYHWDKISSDGLAIESETFFDGQGRPDTSKQNHITVATYSYEPSSFGGTKSIESRLGRGISVTETDAEDRVRKTSGDGQDTHEFTYWADGSGAQNTSEAAGLGGWRMTSTDWLGRELVEMRGGITDVESTETHYDAAGRMVSQARTGQPTQLYIYDALGDLWRSGFDLNGDGVLTPGSTDRLTETNASYAHEGTNWFRVTTTKTWTQDNNASQVLVSKTKERLTLPVTMLRQTIEIDPANNQTVITVTVARAAKLVTETVQLPGVANPRVTISRNGLVQSVREPWQTAPTRFFYDALGRPTEQRDPNFPTQPTMTAYNQDNVRIATQFGPAGSVRYDYLTGTELVAVKTVNGVATRYDYTPSGQVAHVWGAGTYPQWTEYAPDGLIAKLHTYRTTPAGGWDGATWPAEAGDGDVTVWHYDGGTRVLLAKEDAAHHAVAYGRQLTDHIEKRTDARGRVATYSYTAAWELGGITYSDATPPVSFTYDRLGRMLNATDAAGTHTYTHNAASQQTSDSVTGGLFAGITVSAGYDGLFRKETVTATRGGQSLVAQGYTYRPADGLLATASEGPNTALYRYYANTNWVDRVTHQRNGAAVLTRDQTPDAAYRIDTVKNLRAGQAAAVSAVAYRLNARKLREWAAREDRSHWQYGYNERGEVTVAGRFLDEPIPGQSAFLTQPVAQAGLQFGYAYDAIGNRRTATRNGRVETYAANGLNQYTSDVAPPVVDVLGTAEPAAVVTVNGQPATRQRTYWHAAVAIGSLRGPVDLHIRGVQAENGQGQEVVADQDRRYYMPSDSGLCSHDEAGNLTLDGGWTYEWDAENRLTAVTRRFPGAGQVLRYEFGYDWQGRKIWQRLYSTPGAPPALTLYVRDGWNLVAELASPDGQSSTLSLSHTYLWGLDLSGEMEGAGGIGGLLAVRAPGHDSLALYDGNGNITGYADAATGALRASFEYGPFGETLLASGDLSSIGSFRFSTKQEVGETGLLDYGYRHLVTKTGRWLSKDPIEEDGGVNLYEFVDNDSVNNLDYLGEDCIVLAHRKVVGPTYHYALEKLVGCYPRKGEQVAYNKWVGQQANATAKVELLNVQGVTAEHYGANPTGSGRQRGAAYGWSRVALVGTRGISAIHRDVWETGSVLFANIYDDSDGNVDSKWRQVISAAQSYAYAEQGKTGSKMRASELQFSRFPKSIYSAFGNNSNVFVRYVVDRTGMKKMELRYSHPPGRSAPQDEFSAASWRNPKAQ